ncbi:MarR family transcriptional regulator [Tuanshanicoccus lijuaniae]|uniref:MarR family winged helix-turn-helix transcriptional regulator n=1 Tax=Aerococcaceae bacterium zg-1292 TaxID=2774330 RepID=UPI001936EC76|nr:MarR family transcriptional regulator [Aerococcaceae bacterium zg-1292]MBF6978454.1 MarR family transcriptional regulator [Aerococcaceae bacterium zg-BR22]MBS4456153.1 MarR family transcriptional regulator [Aerococcaceae bacterium zg-A91]MBS4458004.1 MarR family transcriptional regulator [Aerococcaceae bacterium zg-BR33]QQA37247.1 MarR family transcriptional regulator [Aerococcaceae bacterium zg-1292]
MKDDLIKSLFQVNTQLNRIKRICFDKIDIMSRSEYSFLQHVIDLADKKEEQTISQVAQELQLSNAAVSRTIKHLLAKEWLVREVVETDRRHSIVKVSPLGREVFTQMDKALMELLSSAVEQIDEEDLTTFITLGKQIHQQLSEHAEDDNQ